MENKKEQESSMMDVTLSMPNTEMLGKLENAETGVSITIKYKTQEEWQEIKNKPLRCIYMGLKEVPNDKGEAVICAGFMSQTESFIAAQIVLVDAVRSMPKGTPLEITYEGKKSNSSSEGSTNIFNIKLLNLK